MDTNSDIAAMMSLSENEEATPVVEEVVQSEAGSPVEEPISNPSTEAVNESIYNPCNGPDTLAPSSEVTDEATTPSPEADVSNIQVDETKIQDAILVSDVILGNVDKHIKIKLLNPTIRGVDTNVDLVHYIVFLNMDHKIPCIFDCNNLYVPKSTVQDANGNWTVTSIEGRRSGFIIKTPGRDLVMDKNFVYDCTIEDGKITSIKEYNRKKEITPFTATVVDDYENAVLTIRQKNVLPKIVKGDKYNTIELLREQVKLAYESVDDIHAVFKIAELRYQIGC